MKNFFSDCVETALKQLIICLFWDPDKQNFYSGNRDEFYGEGPIKLAQYFTIYNTRALLQSSHARNAWATLIAELGRQEKDKSLVFKNNFHHYSCELIAQEGFKNIWAALELLTNIPTKDELKRFLKNKRNIEADITYIPFKNSNYGTLIINCGTYQIVLQIDPNHAICYVYSDSNDTIVEQYYLKALQELNELDGEYSSIKNFCVLLLKPFQLLRKQILTGSIKQPWTNLDIITQCIIFRALYIDNPCQIPQAMHVAVHIAMQTADNNILKVIMNIIENHYSIILENDLETKAQSITAMLNELSTVNGKPIHQCIKDFIFTRISELNQKYKYKKSDALLISARNILKKK